MAPLKKTHAAEPQNILKLINGNKGSPVFTEVYKSIRMDVHIIASNINMYNPINSLYGLIAAGAHQQCNYSHGLYRAFVTPAGETHPNYQVVIPAADRPSAYCFEALNTNSTSATRCAGLIDNRAVHGFTATRDNGMNVLGKAMVGYNAGSGRPSNHYFDFENEIMLGSRRKVSSGSYEKTKFGYWMAIKRHTQTDTQPGYLPYTTFIWPNNLPGAAGLGLDLDGDTIISNVANAGGVIEANTPWCYGYGELEWMSPFQRENDAGNLVDATRENYLERAEQVTSFRVRCI